MKTNFLTFKLLYNSLSYLFSLKGQKLKCLNFKLSKNQLVIMLMVLLTISFSSCSGEDGKMGPEGPQGIAGEDGLDGEDGEDGEDGINCWDLNGNGIGDITNDDSNEDINLDGVVDALDCQGADGLDGNANVQLFKYNLDVFFDYSQLDLNLKSYIEKPENYTYIFYIDHSTGLRYSIPGHIYNNKGYARIYTTPGGALRVNFYDLNDSNLIIPGGEYTHLIVVAIELSNTAKNSGNPISELKAAGVNTSDFDAVAAYFGLNQ